MKTHHSLATWSVAAALALAATATPAQELKFPGTSGELYASSAKAFKGKKIVYIPIVTGFALFDSWTYAIKQESAALGMQLTMQDANWNPDAMTQAISAAINNKADVIIAHNPDVKVLAKLLKQANDAGIYVVQINMVSTQKTDAYVGGDWLGLGATIARDLVKTCGKSAGKSGKVVIVQGPPTAAAAFDQYNGFKAVLEQSKGDLTIVSDQSAGPLWSSDEAKKIVSTALTQHPDTCAVYGFWDYMDLGSAAAIKEAGKQGKVAMYTSGGGSQVMCDKVKAGEFTKYWNYNSLKQGQDIMSAVKMLLQSGQKPGSLKLALYSSNELLTKDNLRVNSCFPEDMVKQK